VALVKDLVRAMEAAATPENARALARYFKVAPGSYGEGDIFLGLKLGDLRQLAKPYAAFVFEPDQWLPMLRSPIHEHRLIALVVMTERAKKSKKPANEAELQMIYDTYLGNTSYVNNWDLVDVSCGPIVGGYLLIAIDRRSTGLSALRCCGIAGLPWSAANISCGVVRPAISTASLRSCYPIAMTLIHKAVGWSLREAASASMEQNCAASLINMRPPCRVRRCVTPSNTSTQPNGSTTLLFRDSASRSSAVARTRRQSECIQHAVQHRRRVPGDITVERSGAVRKWRCSAAKAAKMPFLFRVRPGCGMS
jgi:hypothetical protein